MKSPQRFVRSVLAIVVGLTASLPARGGAQTPQAETESEALVQAGIALRRDGKDQEALALFDRAYALAPTPRALAQRSLARQALGDWLAAERGLTEALRADTDPWIAAYHPVLEQALASVGTHLGWLVVESNVPAARPTLHGASDAEIHLAERARVVAGTLEVALEAEGYRPARRTLQVAPGTEVHVVIDLEPWPPGPSLAPPAAGPHTEGSAPASSGAHRTAGLVAAGIGAAFAGVGIVAWRFHESNAATYDDGSRCLVDGETRGQQCGGYAQAANVALGVEVGSFVLAGAGAALGTWWLAFADRRPSGSVAVRCLPSGPLGIECGGRF